MYSCNICLSVYVWPDSLKRHLKYKYDIQESRVSRQQQQQEQQQPEQKQQQKQWQHQQQQKQQKHEKRQQQQQKQLCFPPSVYSQRVRNDLFWKDLFCSSYYY